LVIYRISTVYYGTISRFRLKMPDLGE